jgi:hypothetical protein
MRFSRPSRGPETLSDLAVETGATAVAVPEAVRSVDLVVVTIPEKNINYYPRQRDGDISDPIGCAIRRLSLAYFDRNRLRGRNMTALGMMPER